jgi:branched-chain amino acid transport system ATP-binding protein
MTVFDNVRVGRHCRTRSGFFLNALRLPIVRSEEEETSERVRALMRLMDLEPVAEKRVADLPFGTQKRVELARALASEPKLLLLDEPASGLNHEEVGALGALIRSIRDRLKLTGSARRASHESRDEHLRTASLRSISARRSPKARRPRCSSIRS